MTRVRIKVIVEGQTESAFIQSVIAGPFGSEGIDIRPIIVSTSGKSGSVHRGGFRRHEAFQRVKGDILRAMKQDPEAWHTTMFDLYGLPLDFPGREEANYIEDPYKKVKKLESSLFDSIRASFEGWPVRFIPYIQLHKFEALLLSDPYKLSVFFFEDGEERAVRNLAREIEPYDSPEHINEHPESAPSKRIIRALPRYAKQKTTAGSSVAEAIGLDTMKRRCPHFSQWIDRLRALKEREAGV